MSAVTNYSISHFREQKLRLRTSDPKRAIVYEMIVDVASKLAKAENREVNEADVIKAIKKNLKQAQGSMELVKSKGGDIAEYESEISILEELCPKSLSREETEIAVNRIFSILSYHPTKKDFGVLMNTIKEVNPGVDASILSSILKERLS